MFVNMRYTGLELFMENLRQLSYTNNNPLINNNPSILSKRPQIQLLYAELSIMIQILFIEKQNDLDEIEEVRNLKTRFKDVAQEAYHIVGLFVYSINYRNAMCPSIYDSIKYSLNFKKVRNHKCSMDLGKIMWAINSIKKEFILILDKLKIDSSPSIESLKMQNVTVGTNKAGVWNGETSRTRNSLGMKQVSVELVVGLERDVGLIRDQLTQDKKQVVVIPIVGMGGLGKTTLATIVFNDPFVVYHFHVRAWATVSQTYERRDLLIQILASMDVQLDPISTSDSQLREILHKNLMGKRYLVVLDDIWSIEAWDNIKLFFPNNHNGSRILVTSRLNEVALHAKSHGIVHQLKYLSDEESWELLRKKVFHGDDCPVWLIEPGMLIAKNCHGLPLAVVVIAGVLTKVGADRDSWERVGQRVSSYILSDSKSYVDILELSYEHLPPQLKDCFLYLGGFPEDHKFRVRKLVWLWVAEGFIQEVGNSSLEEIAEDYLMELVDRNLVIVTDRKCNGSIKTCSLHDLLRELCLEKAKENHFGLKIDTPHRIFTNTDLFKKKILDPSPWVQSLFCFHNDMSLINITNRYFHFYPLLMVLNLQMCQLEDFPQAVGLLVHLRYLAFWYTKGFPSSICNLWSLRTVIVKSGGRLYLPNAISNMVNLKHLWSDGYIYFPSVEKPMNLQTISNVSLVNVAESWGKCFPGIKKLTCSTLIHKNQDFKPLNSLETLMWINVASPGPQLVKKIQVLFPDSLKKLSLSGCCLPWSDISAVQSLPNLEVLNILEHAFLGPRWETSEVQFRQLKFLKLQALNIQQWEASSITFPCLKHLVLDACRYLEEIPLDIGDISTLELIDVDDSSTSVVESLDRIREEQQNFGNYDLKINVKKEMHHLSHYRKLRGLAWMVDW